MTERNWIIYFAEDWGRHLSTSQLLASELASHYNILWVNSLGLREPRLTPGDVKRAWAKISQFAASALKNKRRKKASITTTPPNIHVASPLAIPFLRYRIVRRINRFLVRRYLRPRMTALGIHEPIIVTAAVESVDVLEDLGAKHKVYYCADEYSQIAGMNAELVRILEQELLGKVDLVVASAANLAHEKARFHANVHYLPHGVNYQKFSQALNHTMDMPEDLRAYRKPLIGFVGLIGEHINVELIGRLARELPQASIILIGPLEEGMALPPEDSIIHLGPQPHDHLPRYLAHFEVCILPYAYTERNRFANPTKLREYLAAGCPVVSTLQSEAEKLSEFVDFATDEEEFVEAVRHILKHGPKLPRETISIAMSEQTWHSRAAMLRTLLESSAT